MFAEETLTIILSIITFGSLVIFSGLILCMMCSIQTRDVLRKKRGYSLIKLMNPRAETDPEQQYETIEIVVDNGTSTQTVGFIQDCRSRRKYVPE
jgi:hypothetical protein